MNTQLDKLLVQPTRFAVVACLVSRTYGQASFVEICRAVGIEHSGALSAHARALEKSGYIKQRKSFVGRRPKTMLVLTDKGRGAFDRHTAAFCALHEAVSAK